jgi:hypothetical protein
MSLTSKRLNLTKRTQATERTDRENDPFVQNSQILEENEIQELKIGNKICQKIIVQNPQAGKATGPPPHPGESLSNNYISNESGASNRPNNWRNSTHMSNAGEKMSR